MIAQPALGRHGKAPGQGRAAETRYGIRRAEVELRAASERRAAAFEFRHQFVAARGSVDADLLVDDGDGQRRLGTLRGAGKTDAGAEVPGNSIGSANPESGRVV